MSEEKKDEQQGVDSTDVDEVRGHLEKSPDQEKLSEDQLEDAAGAGPISSWDVSRVKSADWDVSRTESESWDVSKVTDMGSLKTEDEPER